MHKEQALQIIADLLVPCLNKDMQITLEVVSEIARDCNTPESNIRAMITVVKWFNNQNVYNKCSIDRNRYVGAVTNLLALLAIDDIKDLVNDWILEAMNE